MTPSRLDAVAASVLAWGTPVLRDLPWRRTRDPWAILTAEVMLQQTQVARVLDRWPRFLDRFPTVEACSAAPVGDVLREWVGLGYPRRARNLHGAATEIVRAGEFPHELETLLALPGVGAYTARAVLAFAFETDAAVVDTNIARVLARLVGRRLSAREVQTVADGLQPAGLAWEWNQCLMDLGAVLCRPAPACGECPVAEACAWRGRPDVVDPAVASAGVSRPQSPFAGSDREARGRLIRALATSEVATAAVPAVMGRDRDVAARLVDDLVRERLVTRSGTTLRLP